MKQLTIKGLEIILQKEGVTPEQITRILGHLQETTVKPVFKVSDISKSIEAICKADS